MHSHSNSKIRNCQICQKAIKQINKSGKELDKLGVWTIPKKIKKGGTYTIWQRKK